MNPIHKMIVHISGKQVYQTTKPVKGRYISSVLCLSEMYFATLSFYFNKCYKQYVNNLSIVIGI